MHRHPIYSVWNKLFRFGARSLYFSTTTINIVPVVGPTELLTNGTFTAWTADNPDGWTVTGEVGADPAVTQRDPTQLNADVMTVGGAANFYSSATANQPTISQTPATTLGRFYYYSFAVTAYASGQIKLYHSSDTYVVAAAATGTFVRTGRATDAYANLRLLGASGNLTVDTASIQLMTSTMQLFTHGVAYGDFSVTITDSASLWQSGVIFNYTDDNNYTLLYMNRSEAKLLLVKYVAGTPTQLGSWVFGYGVGRQLLARRHKNGTIDVLYNGAALASGIAATGLTGLKAGPFLTNDSITIGNYTWDARSAT